ncbi:spore germination protein (amino acid permease) [Paenibacillus sp. CF384]|nr:spore germination protein (amino acid permease) [Paenibacillus sp. CF384]
MREMKLSGVQVMWTFATVEVVLFIWGMITPTINLNKQDAWIAMLTGGVVAMALTAIIVRLCMLHPRQTLVEFSQAILGKWLGRAIVLPYFAVWFGLNAAALRLFGDFIHLIMLDRTPVWLIMLLMTVLMTYITYSVGIMGIGRFCEIAGPIMVLTLIVGFSLNIVDIKWHYILPIITDFGVLPIMKHSIQTASFLGESLIFFSILPFLEHQRQAYSKSLIAVGMTAVLACLATTLVLLVFGPDVSARMRFPYFMLVRSINLLDFIQNMDIFVIFIWVFGLFARISLYLFITSYEAARWFRVKNWRSFIWFGAPTMFIMALLIPNEAILKSVNLYWQTIAFPICSIGIPLLLLLVSAFRKKKTVQT